LRARSAKAGRFSFSDVVGLAVTGGVVDLGVKIGDVLGGIEAMFRSLAKTSWMTLEDSVKWKWDLSAVGKSRSLKRCSSQLW